MQKGYKYLQLWNTSEKIKGIVQPKIKKFFKQKKIFWQFLFPLYFLIDIEKLKLFEYQHFSEYLLLCSKEKCHTDIFGWTIPVIMMLTQGNAQEHPSPTTIKIHTIIIIKIINNKERLRWDFMKVVMAWHFEKSILKLLNLCQIHSNS